MTRIVVDTNLVVSAFLWGGTPGELLSLVRIVDTGLIVRLVEGRIIIERDVNDKPLVDALLQASIPREQIVLAYAGEPVNESVA